MTVIEQGPCQKPAPYVSQHLRATSLLNIDLTGPSNYVMRAKNKMQNDRVNANLCGMVSARSSKYLCKNQVGFFKSKDRVEEAVLMSESFWLTVLPAKVVATASNVKSILSLSGSQRRLISRKCKVLLRPEFKEPLPQGLRDLLPKMFVCVCVC